MENQGRNVSHMAGELIGQAQMRKDENLNQASKHSCQDTNFLQQTGEGVKNIAQGTATMARGAVQGAASIAQGAAVGATNLAEGAAPAVKNTLGVNNDNNSTTTTPPPNTLASPSTRV